MNNVIKAFAWKQVQVFSLATSPNAARESAKDHKLNQKETGAETKWFALTASKLLETCE